MNKRYTMSWVVPDKWEIYDTSSKFLVYLVKDKQNALKLLNALEEEHVKTLLSNLL